MYTSHAQMDAIYFAEKKVNEIDMMSTHNYHYSCFFHQIIICWGEARVSTFLCGIWRSGGAGLELVPWFKCACIYFHVFLGFLVCVCVCVFLLLFLLFLAMVHDMLMHLLLLLLF